MKIKHIAILGGTGFVGSYMVNRLSQLGYRLTVFTSRRERHRHLLVLPTLQLREINIHNGAELQRQLTAVDAVVNLVGILNESGDDGQGFHQAHVELPRKIVAACTATGVRRLLHMSALNAAANSGASHYLKSKGQGEDLVHAAATKDFQVTSFRPSVIFGPNDGFLNRFAGLLRIAPYFFPLACPYSRFAPVYVADVVQAFINALDDVSTAGQRFDLCGPKDYSLLELVNYTAQLIDVNRKIIPMNEARSLLQARWLEHVPGKPFSLDNYRSLQVDSVCTGRSGLMALGITPTSLETIAPTYLEQENQRGRYRLLRSLARR